MIGQKNLLSSLNSLGDNFPRFSILVGPRGSGKKLMCKEIGNIISATTYFSDIKVDDVRDVITNAYKCVGKPTLYVFADADTMSPAAKNALLKVTEEPPTNAYFILTLTDLNNTLATIRSRGTVFYMDLYSTDEIIQYLNTVYPKEVAGEDIVREICSTPGEVDTIVKSNVVDFYQYVEKVVDNIDKVSGSNSFKIASEVKLKDTDEDKYDLKLFWKAFMSVLTVRLADNIQKYAEGIKITSKYLQELRITGINKQSAFDMWILDIRKAWM